MSLSYKEIRDNAAKDLNLTESSEEDVFYFEGYRIDLSATGNTQINIMKSLSRQLAAKLKVARKALYDVKNWDDELETEWDDAGVRANEALKESR